MRKLTVTLLGLLLSVTVQAASHRTFVAASGTDAGACGPTIPCRSLEYAQSQTNSGGEIIIIQSGGYGNATGGLVIDRSISIIAEPGVFAALAPTSGNGITIDVTDIKVVIKGLAINGRGGDFGINMTNGSSLLVEKSTITGFPSGIGLLVQTAAKVNVVDSVIRDNIVGLSAGNGATVGISGSKVLNNTNTGILLNTTEVTAGTTTALNINDTVVSGSVYCVENFETISGNTAVINATRVSVTKCTYGFIVGGSGNNKMTVSDSTSSGNGHGFYLNYANCTLIVSGSTASNNGTGFNRGVVGGNFFSLGNNTVYGNVTDVNGFITPLAPQ